MADLQSCYFCAAPDDVSEYAVVPPRLGGGDRSVALCPDCKTKLLRVMEPLIERAEAGADSAEAGVDAGSERTNSGGESGTEPGNEPTTATTAPESSTPDNGGDDSGITMSPGGSDPAESAGSATPTPGAGEQASDAAADAPPSYRRAMRMLSNRPFPMDRSEVESMLANAYDLEREDIDAVLERAESEDRLVTENGEIREASQ